MKQKAYRWAVLVALVMTSCSQSCGAAARRNHFSDVPADHWAYDAVNELADLGILVGYPPAPHPAGQPGAVQPHRASGSSPRRPAPPKGRGGGHLSPRR